MLSDLSKRCDRTRMATTLRDKKESATTLEARCPGTVGQIDLGRSGPSGPGAPNGALRSGEGCYTFGFGHWRRNPLSPTTKVWHVPCPAATTCATENSPGLLPISAKSISSLTLRIVAARVSIASAQHNDRPAIQRVFVPGREQLPSFEVCRSV